MCTYSCLIFGIIALKDEDIRGKRVLEVGSRNINGSLRPYVEMACPAEYIGVDMLEGSGVDQICRAEHLIETFGKDSFDVVITTEMLEHVHLWQDVIQNLKGVTKPEGKMILTTRSKGYPFHSYPYDFWRFEIADMQYLFQDWDIEDLRSDPSDPGVFLKVKNTPSGKAPPDLQNHELYNIALNQMSTHVTFDMFRDALIDKRDALVRQGLLNMGDNHGQ